MSGLRGCREGMRVLVGFILLLAVKLSGGERFKIPNSVCGRIPNTYLCDALPVGFQEQKVGQYCPYGQVTFAFGRNHYAQLGLGDYKTRFLPTPLATIYAKVDMLVSSAQGNILRWQGMNMMYAWGRNDRGQLGVGSSQINDTLPNKVVSVDKPVIIESGDQHTLISVPPATADFFEYDDFAGAPGDFIHFGSSSQPIAPSPSCPRCLPWQDTYQPPNGVPKLTGRLCYTPPWAQSLGVLSASAWCYVLKGTMNDRPCNTASPVNQTLANGQVVTWWWSVCNDLAKFSITPDPPTRLAAGSVWRKKKVQVYQAWKMGVFFQIIKSDKRGGGGDGLVAVIQNHGIDAASRPLGGVGSNLGIARTTRYGFDDGIPNSIGIVVRTQGDTALEVRACRRGPFVMENTGEYANCRLGISQWKPNRLCNPLAPDTCCTDVQLQQINTCFVEDVQDEEPHELIIVYAPYVLEVYLDDPRKPKVRFDFDIRQHIQSFKCQGGPKDGMPCLCSGTSNCIDPGGEDVTTCGTGGKCVDDGTAWLGFTSATGDAYSTHEILSWNFVNLGQDGGLVSYGSNRYGQLGLADTRQREVANLVTMLDGIVVAGIAAGAQHTMVLSSLGVVYTWGGNTFGQLGQGDLTSRSTPTKVRSLDSLSTNSEVGDPCVCGKSAGARTCQNLPNVAPCTFKVVSVSAGAYHSIAVVKRDNGAHELWGWGDNQYGQLGCLMVQGVVMCPWRMQPVGSLGNYFTDRIRKESCSGSNVRCMSLPRKLASFDQSGVAAMVMKPLKLVSGGFHNILITADCPTCEMPELCKANKLTREECDCDGGIRYRGALIRSWVLESTECIAKAHEVYVWGSNLRGQLGTNCTNYAHQDYVIHNPFFSRNTCPDSPIPLRLNSKRNVHLLPYYPDLFPVDNTTGEYAKVPVDVAAGHYHNLMLMSDSTVLVWGSNYFGQLGLGDQLKRVKPTPLTFFTGRWSKPPNVSPLDGIGQSIKTLPDPAYREARPPVVIAAGEHHSIVVTQCLGGGFLEDGSCGCKFGWKGPDCDIECNGGANRSCSRRGTFDRTNTRGDQVSCKAYLNNLRAQFDQDPTVYTNDFKCVGLKKAGYASTGAGCPGSLTQDCPEACQFCDDEAYDCEPDGSCYCQLGFTGPDCGFECLPVEGKYFFLRPVGTVAVCDCEGGHTGTFCNITLPDPKAKTQTAEQNGSSKSSSSPLLMLLSGVCVLLHLYVANCQMA